MYSTIYLNHFDFPFPIRELSPRPHRSSKKTSVGRDFQNRGHLSITDLLQPASYPASIPDRNGDRVTGELSRGNELLNILLETSEWL